MPRRRGRERCVSRGWPIILGRIIINVTCLMCALFRFPSPACQAIVKHVTAVLFLHVDLGACLVGFSDLICERVVSGQG